MTGPAESAPEALADLAALLERDAEEIASAYADALRELPNSRYQARPSDDMVHSAGRQTAGMVAALRTVSDAETHRYMADVVRTRLGQGADCAEFIQAPTRLPHGRVDGELLRWARSRSWPLGGGGSPAMGEVG